MLDGIKMYKKTILRFFLQLKRPEYLIYAPFETIYHTVHWSYHGRTRWYTKNFDQTKLYPNYENRTIGSLKNHIFEIF